MTMLKKLIVAASSTLLILHAGFSNAVTEHPDGSLTLSSQEYKQTLANFNMLINLVHNLKEQIKVLEETKQCRGV